MVLSRWITSSRATHSARPLSFIHFFSATLSLGLIMKWSFPGHPLELLTDLSFWIYSLLR
ncbi:hypothetical protein SAMN00768000_1975 [Sulfobacillus thermosulfidooxidans DSM 9293]|uniref:Uncharacterized protein n=1 Tax=Sulfobacillus thermosulfidooxidans (strain DSM 9293 / VKM B-1269 / AT-1) TaxID=929705 RepID=A0A1W1WFC7_SULTA|nr:hypothetical protein [Sulfobacillus thermosulfidooxidans]SMC05011.1 hypothetical protein SAMN00768000_1975 [Sulfobacillus thermosulfidooxidans DSM 9293]